MEKPEISVGKWKGSCHSVWEAMGCDFRQCNFSTNLSFFQLIWIVVAGCSHHFKSYSFKFMYKIPTRVVCVNGKHQLFSTFRRIQILESLSNKKERKGERQKKQ